MIVLTARQQLSRRNMNDFTNSINTLSHEPVRGSFASLVISCRDMPDGLR